MPKELMHVTDFLEDYGITLSRFYLEIKKHPWLVTKLGRRTHIRKIDADRWLEVIKTNPEA